MEQKSEIAHVNPLFFILRLIPTAAVLAILFYFRDLFFSADTLSTVQVIVPLESCREAVFVFLVVLTVLVGFDGIRVAYFSRRKKKEERYAFGSPLKTSVSFLVIFANAALSFFEIELINNYYLYSMETRYIWLGIFITLAIYLMLVFIVNSVSLGMIVGNCFFFAWGAANYFVQQFRGVPLQFIDLASFQTALNVSGNYSYEPNWEMVACLALTCAVCGLFIHAGYWHNFRRIPGKIASRAVSVAIVAGFVGLLFHTDFLTDQGIWLRDWHCICQSVIPEGTRHIFVGHGEQDHQHFGEENGQDCGGRSGFLQSRPGKHYLHYGRGVFGSVDLSGPSDKHRRHAVHQFDERQHAGGQAPCVRQGRHDCEYGV